MSNPYEKIIKSLSVNSENYQYFSLPDLNDERLSKG